MPVAEALACGCGVVGYSGLGGRELFELAHKYSMADEIALGDWGSFIHSIVDFSESLKQSPKLLLERLYAVSRAIRANY